MHEFTPDPRKLFYSRLWCWGTLTGSIIAFVLCNVFRMDGEIWFLYYVIAFMVLLQPINVLLAELDYRKNRFKISDSAVDSQTTRIEINRLTDFVWQIAPFPQTDNGGCSLITADQKIELRFRYLSDGDALSCMKQLRQLVPLELQRNWPQFCHSTALRLFNDIHHPERELPSPTDDEQIQLNESKRKLGNQVLWVIAGGFVIALVIGYLLERIGVQNGLAWAVGIYFFAQKFYRGMLTMQRSVVEQKFDVAQQIWNDDVMETDRLPKSAT